MSELAAPSSVKVPLRERINIRMIIFALIVGFPFAWVAYTFFSDMMHQGVLGKEGDYTKVELKWMSTFDFNQTNGRLTDIPQRWRDLDGKKVILRGEIYAPDSAGDQLDHFDLCYSIAKCCFSGPPQVQHFVKSRAKEGPVPYYGGLVEVRGVLHVKVIPGQDKVASVYQMDVESVDQVQ